MRRRPPRSPLFPYTTLFRSALEVVRQARSKVRFGELVYQLNGVGWGGKVVRSEEHTSELQSLRHLVCRLLLEKKKKNRNKAKSNEIQEGETHRTRLYSVVTT